MAEIKISEEFLLDSYKLVQMVLNPNMFDGEQELRELAARMERQLEEKVQRIEKRKEYYEKRVRPGL